MIFISRKEIKSRRDETIIEIDYSENKSRRDDIKL